MWCPLFGSKLPMFPVFWEERGTFDAKGVHFAVKATAKLLPTLEWLGQEYGRVLRWTVGEAAAFGF